MVGVSPGLRSGTESGRISLVTLEAARTAKLLSAELLATEPLRPQGASSHAQTPDSGDCLLGASRAILIRQIVLLALTCIAIAVCSAQSPNDSLRKPPLGYELYSWQGPDGGWNFRLLPSPSGVNVPAEAVFNKKFLLRGVDGLDREILKLPVGATIYWLDHILGSGPQAKGSERLMYPPANIVDQVRRSAKTRHLEVQMLRANQNP